MDVPVALQKHAEERAKYLVAAYANEIDEATREAFVNDVKLELINACRTMLAALAIVREEQGASMVHSAVNRHARRAIQKQLRKG